MAGSGEAASALPDADTDGSGRSAADDVASSTTSEASAWNVHKIVRDDDRALGSEPGPGECTHDNWATTRDSIPTVIRMHRRRPTAQSCI